MLEKLSKILNEHTETKVEVTPQSVLLEDLGLNSFDLIGLVSDIEDEFDVEISDLKLRSFKTVQDVLNFIENKG